VKNTDPSEQYYEVLIKAQEKISEVVAIINDKKAVFENQLKMFEIVSLLGESIPNDLELIQPARRLVKMVFSFHFV
jgi:hypothetical protein